MLRTFQIVAALSLISALTSLLAACGGDTVLSDCHAQCEAQANGKNCPSNSDYLDLCNGVCDGLVPHLSADCHKKAGALYACGKDQSWECSQGGEIAMMTNPQKCEKETAAYAPCFNQQN